MECLLQVLRARSCSGAGSERDWHAAFALADEQRILPWWMACLRRSGAGISTGFEEKLQAAERQATAHSFLRCAELAGVLRAFHQADVAVIPLKGPSLGERLYGDARLRPSLDLDLLVRRADFARSVALLRAEGFLPGSHPDDYHQPFRRGTTMVELHFHVENPLSFAFPLDSAWERARGAAFQGVPIHVFAPPDELLYLCLHGVRHRFARLGLILDIQLGMQAAAAEDRCSQPLSRQMGALLELGEEMVRLLHAAPEFRPGEAQMPPAPHLRTLARVLWHELLSQAAAELDWRAQHRFFLQLERPGWARFRTRVRHLRILPGRVIQADFDFAARFGLHRPWQARLLRPARLLGALLR